MRFANPELLWLLAALPVLFLATSRVGRAAALLYPSTALVRDLGRVRKASAGRLRLVLRVLAAGLFVVALARPQQGLGAGEVETSGIDILLAIDVSGSMKALDFELEGQPANRLDVARVVVEEFIAARPGDRIGLVAFAGRPYLVSPLTLDHDWLRKNLERVEIGLVEDGTAIGSAIAASTNRLRDREAKSRIVILLTDGVNNAGKVSPLTAAEAARALGLRVHTILAGKGGEVPIPVTDRFGRERIVTAEVDADPETLQQVADRTGGSFFRATDTDSLAQIYAQIDRMEKTTASLKQFERYRDLHAVPLLVGLLFLALELLLGETRLRRLP